MNDPTREEIAAQIAAAEARTDTKIARLEGKIDLVVTKLDGIAATSERGAREAREVKFFVIGTGVAVLAVLIGVLAYGDALFGRGMDVRDLVRAVISELPPAAPSTR